MSNGDEYITDKDIRSVYLDEIRSKRPGSKSAKPGIKFGSKFVEKSGFYHKELFGEKGK